MKRRFFVMLLVASPLMMAGQESLIIGDTLHILPKYLPDNNKVVILDFWGTSCGTCIEMLPKVDSLQKRFANELQFLVVDIQPKDDSQRVARFFRNASYKYILGDTMLRKLFPFQTIPHCVWLNRDGIVTGISNGRDVTAENIMKMLSQPKKIMYTKSEAIRYTGDDVFTNFAYRSIITDEVPGLAPAVEFVYTKDQLVTRYHIINYDLKALLHEAWPRSRFHRYSKLPFNKIYCYELNIPPTPKSAVKRYMQEDLLRYFRIESPHKIKNTK